MSWHDPILIFGCSIVSWLNEGLQRSLTEHVNILVHVAGRRPPQHIFHYSKRPRLSSEAGIQNCKPWRCFNGLPPRINQKRDALQIVSQKNTINFRNGPCNVSIYRLSLETRRIRLTLFSEPKKVDYWIDSWTNIQHWWKIACNIWAVRSQNEMNSLSMSTYLNTVILQATFPILWNPENWTCRLQAPEIILPILPFNEKAYTFIISFYSSQFPAFFYESKTPTKSELWNIFSKFFVLEKPWEKFTRKLHGASEHLSLEFVR